MGHVALVIDGVVNHSGTDVSGQCSPATEDQSVKSNLVSVVIPVYNAERYVGEAIESVLAQANANLQVIAVNDGSTDNSESVLSRYQPRVQAISQKNTGVSGALNRGIEHARGEFFGFCGADDLWAPDKLQRQFDALAADPDLDVVFGNVEQFISPDVSASESRKWVCPTEPMPGYHTGAMLIRRAAFLRVGGFETKWKFGEFLDWFARAEELNLRHTMLPEVVYRRRIHGANMTIRQRESQRDYLHILKARLERKRKSSRS